MKQCSFQKIGTDKKGWHIYACKDGCCNQDIHSPHPPHMVYADCRLYAQSKTGGLGDLISNVLSKLGITEETVKRWLGIQEGCGCNKRKKFLNTILPLRKKE